VFESGLGLTSTILSLITSYWSSMYTTLDLVSPITIHLLKMTAIDVIDILWF
jgi:hypothetical protein